MALGSRQQRLPLFTPQELTKRENSSSSFSMTLPTPPGELLIPWWASAPSYVHQLPPGRPPAGQDHTPQLLSTILRRDLQDLRHHGSLITERWFRHFPSSRRTHGSCCCILRASMGKRVASRALCSLFPRSREHLPLLFFWFICSDEGTDQSSIDLVPFFRRKRCQRSTCSTGSDIIKGIAPCHFNLDINKTCII